MSPVEIEEIATRARALSKEQKDIVIQRFPLSVIRKEIARREKYSKDILNKLGYDEAYVENLTLEERLQMIQDAKNVLKMR